MSKGSGRRPQQVSEDELARNWHRTFGGQDESPGWIRERGFQPPRDERLERFRESIAPGRDS